MTDPSIPQRTCNKCGKSFPSTPEYFRPQRNNCRSCERAEAKQYYRDHRAEVLEKKRQHRIENPELYAERDQQRYLNNPEKEKARWASYRQRNHDEVLNRTRRWRDQNPDKVKSYTFKYYYDNREREKQKARRQYQKNKPYYIAYAKQATAKRRAIIAQADGSFSSADIRGLYAEQEGRCFYCGIPIYLELSGDVHVDHVIPISRGGSNSVDNLVCACASCNLSKKDKLVSEWEAVRGW